MARNPNCSDCGNKLSKPRFVANKRKCYRCEVKAKRAGRQRAHDKRIESEDFTADDYWQLYEEQEGHCAIYSCRAQGKSKHLAVEHDHKCEMGHDPKRWCRVCVRGLVCIMHNEWIGRTGDDPDVFASLADYLRYPPARETMLSKMVVGNLHETVATLHLQYGVPLQSARKMADLARSVGPRPRQIMGHTIEIRYVRIPRSGEELYQIIESEPRVSSDDALVILIDEYDLPESKAKDVLNSAWQSGKRRVRTAMGIISIEYHGRGANQAYMFSIQAA